VLWLVQAVAVAQESDPAYLTTNPYLGTEVSPYDPRISQYSTYGAKNPYTTDGGEIYAQDGTYLGRLNSNRYDPESVANPYGQYGSPYSPNSINNSYGTYGSPYSAYSPNNPYTSTPPVVRYDDPDSDLSVPSYRYTAPTYELPTPPSLPRLPSLYEDD
jgi:hypothetical protein